MDNWTPIIYRGFWDFPRVFLARHRGDVFLFTCLFDEGLDDYPETFEVYLVPEFREEDLPQDWSTLVDRAIHHFGPVPTSHVTFDLSKQKQIRSDVLEELYAQKIAS